MRDHSKDRRKVYCVEKDTDIYQARTLMREKNVRHLPVVDTSGRLLGIVSDRDVRTAMPKDAYDIPGPGGDASARSPVTVETIMTTSPFCISQTYTMQDVLMLFREKKVGAFPIVDEHKVVVGIISDRDLLKSFIDLLGAGSPGCFVGVLIPPSPRDTSRIVSGFAEEGIAIASMLVIQNWQEGRHAVFMYLLTHNIHQTKRIIKDMNVEPIDPMQWFFYRHTGIEGG